MIPLAFNLRKDIYPDGVVSNNNRVIVENAGGDFTTDWINPTSGLSQYWNAAFSTAPSMVYSIVTGGGFTGNAQRVEFTNSGQSAIITSSSILQAGRKYTVSFKYRCSKALSIYQGSAIWLGNTPINTGTAATFTATDTADFNSTLTFVMFGAVSGDYFEVDEVNITELPVIAEYPFDGNVTDYSGNGNDCTNLGATLTEDEYAGDNKAYSFNGTTAYMTSPINSAARSIAIKYKSAANSRDLIQLSATAKISIDSNGDITTTGLTGVRVIQWQLTSYYYAYVEFDSHTADSVQFGYSSTYFSGQISEIYIANRLMSDAEIKAIFRLSPNTDLLLYSYGEEMTGTTGGWSNQFVDPDGDATKTYTDNADNFQLKITDPGGSSSSAVWKSTVNAIDVTNYNTVRVTSEILQDSGTTSRSLSISFADTPDTRLNIINNFYVFTSLSTIETVDIDISAITGSKYIYLYVAESNGTKEAKFYDIKLIK